MYVCACASAHDHIQMQRDTEIKQKFFFLPFIYSGRKKQLTSIVDKVDTKKERTQLNECAQQQQKTTRQRNVLIVLFLQDLCREYKVEQHDDQCDQ